VDTCLDAAVDLPRQRLVDEDPANSTDKVMWLNAFSRLKPGATLENVQAEVKVVFGRMMQAFYPASLAPDVQKRAMSQYLVVRDAHAGTFPGREDVSSQLKILLAVAGVVLLIACANVANLLLARATARQREMSVRSALGASRSRIYRQLVTENLVLWSLGGLVGLLVGFGASRILVALISDPEQPYHAAYAPDWRIFGFTAGIALITGVLFGVVPARRALRADINRSLRESSRSVTQSGHRLNLAKALVVGQVALSFLLTVGAGLLVRTIWNLQSISLGFPKERMLQVDVDGVSAGYKDNALTNFYTDLSDRVSAVPGVQGVAYSRLGLLTGGEAQSRIQIDGVIPEREDDRSVNYDYVSPGYFGVLGVPLVMGRDISPQDTSGSPKVCLINEELAKRLFPRTESHRAAAHAIQHEGFQPDADRRCGEEYSFGLATRRNPADFLRFGTAAL
jgi:predicted permease